MVSSKSQINTRSGGFTVSEVSPVSEAMLRVGLGLACRRPRVLPDFVVGVVLAEVLLVFGDMDSGEIGECECARSVGVVGRPLALTPPLPLIASVGLSGRPVVTWNP